MQSVNAQHHGLKTTASQDEWMPQFLDVIAVVFVTALLVSNLAAQKMFKLGPVTFSAGILVFPISYIFGDILRGSLRTCGN